MAPAGEDDRWRDGLSESETHHPRWGNPEYGQAEREDAARPRNPAGQTGRGPDFFMPGATSPTLCCPKWPMRGKQVAVKQPEAVKTAWMQPR